MSQHIKKGLVVYTTLTLQQTNQFSIEKLKKAPKEAMVEFSNICSVSTKDMPDNWIQIKMVDGSVYFENRSIINFISIAEKNSLYIFQKITGRLAININLIKFKSNFSVVELVNGDIFHVNRHYKGRLRKAIFKVWEE